MTLNVSKSVTADQLAAYYRKTAAIADRMGKSIRYEDVMGALQRIYDNDFRRPATPSKRKSANSILQFSEEVTVGPLRKKFVRREYFKNRPGLCLLNDMELVLSATEDAVPNNTPATLKSFELAKYVYDREIKDKLPQKHEVELWQIAELIERQKNGEAGILLTNEHSNIFYVAGFAIRVLWGIANREWVVSARKFGASQWARGRRVFSSN